MTANPALYPQGRAEAADTHFFQWVRRVTVNLDPDNVPAGEVLRWTALVPEARVGDIVLSVEVPLGVGGMAVGQCGRVQTDGEVPAYLINPTGSPVDLGARDFVFTLARCEDVAGVVTAPPLAN